MADAGAGYGPADSVLGVQTPEGIEFALFPAGLPVRACAWAIDAVIQWIVVIGVLVITEFLGDFTGYWFFLLMVFGIDWFYHVICDIFFRGQSPGKKIMGIRVVQSGGSPVNPGASFLRNLLRFADTFMFFCPIAFVTMGASPGFRRIGDWAAGTLVVYTSHSLAPPLRRPGGRSLSDTWFLDLEPAFPPRPLSEEEKQAVIMFARRYPLLGEARACEIAEPFVEFLERSGLAESPGAANSGENSVTANFASNSRSAASYLLGLARRTAGGLL
ncbi:MAG: RDD family protein [Treponema sp.]|jgi:uncharacterized RDD family membrane protein YckC|nr:RDD family protein [Treponema sp.]